MRTCIADWTLDDLDKQCNAHRSHTIADVALNLPYMPLAHATPRGQAIPDPSDPGSQSLVLVKWQSLDSDLHMAPTREPVGARVEEF